MEIKSVDIQELTQGYTENSQSFKEKVTNKLLNIPPNREAEGPEDRRAREILLYKRNHQRISEKFSFRGFYTGYNYTDNLKRSQQYNYRNPDKNET